MTQEIKPCPCGKIAYCKILTDGNGVHAGLASCQCQRHAVIEQSTFSDVAYNNAIEKWNTRKG